MPRKAKATAPAAKKSKTTTKKAPKAAKKAPKATKKAPKAAKAAKKSEIKSKAIKKVTKNNQEESKTQEIVENVNPVVEYKQRIKRKIVDFNKFHQERETALLKRQKEIDNFLNLDSKQIQKAIAALQQFAVKNQEKNPLLEKEDGFLYIELTMNTLPESFSIRPVQM